MSERLASAVLVSALVRRVNQAGGSALIFAKGDSVSRGVLVLALE